MTIDTDSHFISDKSIYDDAMMKLGVIADTSARLPRQVFQKAFNRFIFFPFDQILSPEFWDILTVLAKAQRDSKITMVMLEPHPESYYFKHFGRYAALHFNVDETEVAYLNALKAEPTESSADALIYIANTIIWHSTSMTWAIWAERKFEIGILACAQDLLKLIEFPNHTKIFTTEDALSNLIALTYRDQKIPKDIVTAFITNYGGQ